MLQDKANDNAADGKDGLLSSDSIDEVSVGQLGEPVKQNVEAVHETITQVSEVILFKSVVVSKMLESLSLYVQVSC